MRYNSTLLSQCILGVTFDFDLSRSLFLYNINVWPYVSGKFLTDIFIICGNKLYNLWKTFYAL